MKKYLTLVNKENKIKQSYLKNIKLVNRKNYQNKDTLIEEETALAFDQLKNFLKRKNIKMEIDDAYRSQEHQQNLKEQFSKEYGEDYANAIVAEPGTSEHHTGLAIDIVLEVNGKYDEENDEILEHLDNYKQFVPYLSKFGFIIRYPEGKEEITGYPYEPWHIRYVGKIPATIMEKNNWTIEEYLKNFSAILYVNKPTGITSFDVVNEISNIFGIKRVGHTGTLDPLAEGVLIVTVGQATKIAELITAEDKEYKAGVLLGVETDTLDITGKVTKSKPVDLSKDIEKVINSYQKTYMQEVPIYSAIKVNGKKLYEYARSGKEVELPKKEVTVKKIKLLSSDNDTFMIKALVTKGCYIRSLIRDIGRSLDTYATMTTLVRTKQGKVDIKETNTLEEIKTGTSILHKIDEVLDLSTITVNEEIERKIKNGVKLPNKYQIKNKVIFKNKNNKILGIYKVEKDMLRVWKNF